MIYNIPLREREREIYFIAVFFLTNANIHYRSFLLIIFPGRTTNGAGGQSSTSPEKTVTLPRSATLSGQSM